MSTPRNWMREAVDLAKKSQAEQRDDQPPLVGVVIVKDGKMLGSGYRGETGAGDHAEFGVLTRLTEQGVDLNGAEAFTTLEPCSRRGLGKIPCAVRLRDAGIARVWIGLYDPNPKIYREGWRILRDAGVELKDFDAELRAEIAADNNAFLSGFRTAKAGDGVRSFDYSANDGQFVVEACGHHFTTKWSSHSENSVWAYGDVNPVGHARHATRFEHLDQPGALDFSSRSRAVHEGEIVAFKSGRAYLLVRVMKVHEPRRGADRRELKIAWELRAPAAEVEAHGEEPS